MSQQEFVPRSESVGARSSTRPPQDTLNDEDEIIQPHYPYSWSGKLNKQAGPRDELPSSYAEPTLQRGYAAQDAPSTAKQQHNASHTTSQQWSRTQRRATGQQFGPDGDAFEQGYRPYNTYTTDQRGQQSQSNVPPWARPQPRKRGSMGWLFIVIVLFFLMKPIFSLFGLLFAGIGVAFFAIVLPIFLLLLMFSIFKFILRAAFWPGRYHRGPSFRRGPFWW